VAKYLEQEKKFSEKVLSSLLGMGTDLSKLKKTEDELRKREEKYRQKSGHAGSL
jgi:hypothetical protein